MKTPRDTIKSLVPFTGAPLVPGNKGGGLRYWRQERKIEGLNERIVELTKVTRRLSQELIEMILYLQDPTPKTRETVLYTISRLAGALKAESAVLGSLFQLGDLHPALERIFLERQAAQIEQTEGQPAGLSAPPNVPDLSRSTLNIFHLLTDRELEYVTLVLAGYTVEEIGSRMHIERFTVHVYAHNVKNRARTILRDKGDTDGTNSRTVARAPNGNQAIAAHDPQLPE